MTEPEPVVEIKDPYIDTEEILECVQDRLRQRRAQAQTQGLDYDQLIKRGKSALEDKYLSSETLEGLDRLHSSAEGMLVPLVMRKRGFPLFDSVLFSLENLLHKLVLKYLNRMAGRQIVFNLSASQMISDMTHRQAEDRRYTEALEQRLMELEERLPKLEPSKRE